MTHFQPISWTLLFFLSLMTSGLSSCTNTPSQESLNTAFKEEIKDLKPQAISELTLAKEDPTQGTPWVIVLTRSKGVWEISSLSPGKLILDKIADDVFIEHLLDTLSSARILDDAPHGPPATFGLEPPRFALRWKTESKSRELRIGAILKNGSQSYFTLDGKKVSILEGTVVRMLEQIQGWESLRKQTWTTDMPDDIDEVEIQKGGRKPFYSQRDGNQWNDREHHSISHLLPLGSIDSLLERIMTDHWKELIEELPRADRLRSEIDRNPDYIIHLKGRVKTPIALKIKGFYGIYPDRSNGVFLLNSKLIEVLNQLRFY